VTEPLRPMSTGEVLDRSFAIYRKHFSLFLSIAAVTHLVSLAYQLLTIKSATPHVRHMGPYYLHVGLSWAFSTVVLTFSQAATVKAVAAVHLGEATSVWAAYRGLRGRILSIFGVLAYVFLIAGLATVALVFVAAIILGALLVASGSAGLARSQAVNAAIGFGVVGGVLAIFVAVYARYALAIQACVVENLGAWAAMKRSVSLSKGGRLRIAAVYLVFVILSLTAILALAWLAGLAGRPWHSRFGNLILNDVSTFVAGSLTGPLVTIGISLLYYDERVRKEAFDLQLMLSSLEPIPPPVAASPVQI
jgi:hypothetical protein